MLWKGTITTDTLTTKSLNSCNSVTIYTGKISYVGEHHIEYDINTYRGCSGAIVFLLEHNEQPPTVEERDSGKAIDGHAGFKYILSTNIGIQLKGYQPALSQPEVVND
jgi:hypothetical protein